MQLAVLPQRSVAVHVRVITLLQLEPGLLWVSLKVGVIAPSQLSLAVTLALAGTSLKHCTDASVGHPLSTGAVVSLTVMCWVQLAVLPQRSVAVHVRVITLWQLEPGLLWVSLKVGVIAPSQLSVAVTLALAGTSLKHCTVASDGHPLSTGAVLSWIVMVRVHEAVFPQPSVAVKVSVIIFGQVPDDDRVAVTVAVPQLSVAVASLELSAGTSPSHWNVRFPGHVIVGGVVSLTVMVCVHVAVLPQ